MRISSLMYEQKCFVESHKVQKSDFGRINILLTSYLAKLQIFIQASAEKADFYLGEDKDMYFIFKTSTCQYYRSLKAVTVHKVNEI